jgi:hypothetical protein
MKWQLSCWQPGKAGLTQQRGLACDELLSRPSAACQHLPQPSHHLADGLLAEAEARVDVQERLQSRLLLQGAQLLQEPQPSLDEIVGSACRCSTTS